MSIHCALCGCLMDEWDSYTFEGMMICELCAFELEDDEDVFDTAYGLVTLHGIPQGARA